jgi:hypothetical protein
MKFSKGKNLLIKNNITRDVDATSRNIQALKSFVHGAISQEDTSFRPESKFRALYGPRFGQQAHPKTRNIE